MISKAICFFLLSNYFLFWYEFKIVLLSLFFAPICLLCPFLSYLSLKHVSSLDKHQKDKVKKTVSPPTMVIG